MHKQLAKLVISIAFGIIVGQTVGRKTQTSEFFSYRKSGAQISKYDYYENVEDGFKKEVFNRGNAIYFGSISSSVLLILLFLPDVFDRKRQ